MNASNNVLCLQTARRGRDEHAIARRQGQVLDELAAVPPQAIHVDEQGLIEAQQANEWQGYFDALGLADVRVCDMTDDDFRLALATCLPVAAAVRRWAKRPVRNAPATDTERYCEAVLRGEDASGCLHPALAGLRDAVRERARCSAQALPVAVRPVLRLAFAA